MTKYDELYDRAIYTFGSMQVKPETLQLMELVDREDITNFMEIGVAEGFSFYLWATIAKENGLKIGVDAPNGPWGIPDKKSYTKLAMTKQRLLSYKPNTHIFFGNSHDVYVQDWVGNTLGINLLDFLFIDGDHSYEGAKADYDFYSKFVRKNGIIALHDIKKSEKHAEVGCTVPKFWDELKGDKTEFISDTSHWGGIGVIRKA